MDYIIFCAVYLKINFQDFAYDLEKVLRLPVDKSNEEKKTRQRDISFVSFARIILKSTCIQVNINSFM